MRIVNEPSGASEFWVDAALESQDVRVLDCAMAGRLRRISNAVFAIRVMIPENYPVRSFAFLTML